MIDRHASPSQSRAAAADAGEVLVRFRDAIDAGLRQAVPLHSSPVYDMLRYHLGIDGSDVAGGKALRPTLCLLVCDALGGAWTDAIPAAVSLELVHNFSLIHDDIQDNDRERHHRATVWARWGVPQAINAGDAMFCLSSLHLRELRAHFDDGTVIEAMTLLQEATREMIEGQVLDVGYEDVLEVSQDEYLHMIACKTGALLRASIELGALLADAGAPIRLRCRRFGEATGRLFQIRDDMLGVWGETDVTGKPVGADIQRKKKSMPIVMALSVARKSARERLLSMYSQEALTKADVAEVQDIFRELKVQAGVLAMAEEAHQQALELAGTINFSDEGRAQLISLVNFLLERDH